MLFIIGLFTFVTVFSGLMAYQKAQFRKAKQALGKYTYENSGKFGIDIED